MWGRIRLDSWQCLSRYIDRSAKTHHRCARPNGHEGNHQSFTRTWFNHEKYLEEA